MQTNGKIMMEFSMLLRFFIDIMENKKVRADLDLKLIKGDALKFLRIFFYQLIIVVGINYLAPLQRVSNPGSTTSKTPESSIM